MKNPYNTVNYLRDLGIGTHEYELIEILSPEETSRTKPPKGFTEKALSFF